jgi:hypothetical protein
MALREVTVEVFTKATVKVIAESGTEAVEKAKTFVLYGNVVPMIVNWDIIDVQPVKEV